MQKVFRPWKFPQNPSFPALNFPKTNTKNYYVSLHNLFWCLWKFPPVSGNFHLFPFFFSFWAFFSLLIKISPEPHSRVQTFSAPLAFHDFSHWLETVLKWIVLGASFQPELSLNQLKCFYIKEIYALPWEQQHDLQILKTFKKFMTQ